MRARSLKPGLFKNELLGTSDPINTVIFEGLWCMADRAGRIEDRPLRIHAEVNPYRPSASTVQALCWLVQAGFVIRYEVDGVQLLQICNFLKHQQPHIREPASKFPGPPDQQVVEAQGKASAAHLPSTNLAALTPDSPFPFPDCLAGERRLAPPTHAPGPEGDRDTGAAAPLELVSQQPAKPKTTTRGTRIPPDFALTPERREFASSLSLHPLETFAKFVDFWRAKAGADAVKVDWEATWRNWCRNETARPARFNGARPPGAPARRLRTADEIEAEERARALQ
ncbi:MAG: hypothetical protein RL684_1975 [Pseudomonadota bacterium]|jgi:hypothetical protein